MNYVSIRYLIYGIILIAYIFLKNYKILIVKKRWVNILVFILPLTILFSFSFERNIIKFDTLEEAFFYSYPGDTIYDKYLGKDYALIVYGSNEDSKNTTHFLKENGKWNFTNPNKLSFNGKIGRYETCTISTYEIKERKILVIYIDYFSADNIEREISDSLKTEFKVEKEAYEYGTFYSYTAIIESTNDYHLIIDRNKKKLPRNAFIMKELEDY